MLTGALTALLMPISAENSIFPLGTRNGQEGWGEEGSVPGVPPTGLAGWRQNKGSKDRPGRESL